MQLGELAYASVISDSDGPCPFCESKSTPKKPTLEITNDSHILGKNTSGGDKIGKPILHPRTADVEIWNEYWLDEDKSKVANNAHHIIPGNAAFAKVPKLHEWLAWKVTVKKAWYSKTETAAVGTIRRETKDSGSVTVTTTHEVVRESASGSKKIEREITTSGNKVYGLVEYDINGASNGVWLPSSNAVYGWSKHTGAWKKAYAEAAMIEHKCQFHDAHPMYSNSVKNELNEIAKKIEKRSAACIMGCDTPEKDPIPAPQKLNAVLNKLSTFIRDRKLKLESGKKVKKRWSTSDLAVGFKLP